MTALAAFFDRVGEPGFAPKSPGIGGAPDFYDISLWLIKQ